MSRNILLNSMVSHIKFEYRIVAIYLLIGSLWIVFSDNILNRMVEDKTVLSNLQTFKGWFYVAITGLLFFIFLKKHLKKLRITEDILLQRNKELKSVSEHAEASDRLKTVFLQNISHELRTPMNGIVGFSQILMTNDLPAHKRTKYLNIIQDSSNQLLQIISDIVDISKIEAGVIELYVHEFPLNSLMKKLYEANLHQVELRGNKLMMKCERDDPGYKLKSDEQKIRQILQNLLSNAQKFTHNGVIIFGYNLGEKEVLFSVSDTGIGIPLDSQAKIFDRFNKGINHFAADLGGTGLGLAISKGLVEAMNGKIWFKSKPGKGSIFYFTIPID